MGLLMNCAKIRLLFLILMLLLPLVQNVSAQEKESPVLEDITGICDLSLNFKSTHWELDISANFLNPKLLNATIDHVSLEIIDIVFIGGGRQILNNTSDYDVNEKLFSRNTMPTMFSLVVSALLNLNRNRILIFYNKKVYTDILDRKKAKNDT